MLIGVKDRGDLLTVREIARIQGFPDDFIFYGIDAYDQVLTAFPPPIASKIGQTISRTLHEYRLVRGGERQIHAEAGTTNSKRSRTDIISSSRSNEILTPSKKPRVELRSSPAELSGAAPMTNQLS